MLFITLISNLEIKENSLNYFNFHYDVVVLNIYREVIKQTDVFILY